MTLYEFEFCKKSIISDISEIADSASTTDENKFKLIDRNDDIVYGSIGASTGTRTITFTFSSAKTVDRIILKNINWKNFTIQYNSSTNFTPTQSYTNNTLTDMYIQVTKLTTITSIVISVTETMTAGDVIRASQIIFCESLYQPATTFASQGNAEDGLVYLPFVSQKTNMLSDGSFDKTFIKSGFGFQLKIALLSTANQASFKSVFDWNKRNSLIFIPEPDSSTWNGIYSYVHWNNALDIYNATSGFTINGFNANIDLIPAAGIG